MSLIFILTMIIAWTESNQLNLTEITINGSLSCGDTISGYLNQAPYEQTFYSFSLPTPTTKTNVKLTTCYTSMSYTGYTITYLYIYNASGYRMDYPRSFPSECYIGSNAETLDQELDAGESYIFAIAKGPRSNYNSFTLNIYCSEPIIQPIIKNQTGDYYIATSYSTIIFALPWKTIYCTPGKHCYVVCDQRYGCRATTINASATDYLTVICNEYDSCNNLKIIGAKLETNLICDGDDTCSPQWIHTQMTSTFNLNCFGIEACRNFDDDDLKNVSAVNIVCDGLRACRSMSITSHNLDMFTMECRSTDSCFYVNVNLKNINHTSFMCSDVSCRKGTQVKIDNGINTVIECNGVHACEEAVFNVSNNGNVTLITGAEYAVKNSILYAFDMQNLFVQCTTMACYEFDMYITIRDEVLDNSDSIATIDCMEVDSCRDTLTIWSNDASTNNILLNCGYCWDTSIFCMNKGSYISGRPNLRYDEIVNCHNYTTDEECYGNSTELLCDYVDTDGSWTCSDDSCCVKVTGYCPPTVAPTVSPTATPTISPVPTTPRKYDDDDIGFGGAGAGGGIGGVCGMCLLCLCIYYLCKKGCGSDGDYDGPVTEVTKTTYWSDGTKTKSVKYKY